MRAPASPSISSSTRSSCCFALRQHTLSISQSITRFGIYRVRLGLTWGYSITWCFAACVFMSLEILHHQQSNSSDARNYDPSMDKSEAGPAYRSKVRVYVEVLDFTKSGGHSKMMPLATSSHVKKSLLFASWMMVWSNISSSAAGASLLTSHSHRSAS